MEGKVIAQVVWFNFMENMRTESMDWTLHSVQSWCRTQSTWVILLTAICVAKQMGCCVLYQWELFQDIIHVAAFLRRATYTNEAWRSWLC